MFCYTRQTIMLNGASEPGAFGIETVTSFSKSPKKAMEGADVVVSRMEGEEATPIMLKERLTRNGKVLFDRWG